MTETAALIIKVDSSGAAKATANLDKLDRAAGHSERAANKLGKAWGVAVGLISSAVIVGATRAFIRQADAMANMSAKLKLVTGSTIAATAAQRDLFDLSQKTSADLEATTELYVKLGQSSKDLAGNHSLLLGITEKVSKALVISGADAASSAAVIRQFSQAMAAGALRGDEFISVIEGAPRLARAIADGMGVAVGSLRKLAAEGKLTSGQIIKALEDQGATLDREFGEMPLTVGRATQQVRNALTQLIGDTDKTSGASRDLAEAIASMARVLESDETKRGFASVVSGLASVIAFAAEATAKISGFIGKYKEFLASKGLVPSGPETSLNDLQTRRQKLLDAQQRLGGGLFGSAPDPISKALGIGDKVSEDIKRQIAEIDGLIEARARLAGVPAVADFGTALNGLKPFSAVGNKPFSLTDFNSAAPSGAPAGSAAPESESKAVNKLQSAYLSLLASQRERIALFGDETEAAKVRYQTEYGELKNLDPVKKAQLVADAEWIDAQDDMAALEKVWADSAKEYNDTLRDRSEATKRAQEAIEAQIDDMRFELSLMGLSNDEREREIALRYAGRDATAAQREEIASLATALSEARAADAALQDIQQATVDLATGALSNFGQAGDAFEDFADRIKRISIQLLAEKAVRSLFAMFMGGTDTVSGESTGTIMDLFSGSGFGFASGGYTGPGGKDQPAGVVHKGEVVWSQQDVSRAGGVGAVEGMRKGLRGYADGGPVGAAPSRDRMEVTVNLTNKGEPMQAKQTGMRQDGNRLIIDMVLDAVAGDMSKPGGKVNSATAQAFGLSRRGIAVA